MNNAKKLSGWIKRILKWKLMIVVLIVGIFLVGLLPVNNDFQAPEDGIKLYVVSNSVHADIILPKTHALVDWSEEFDASAFQGDVSQATHVAFGWGDRGFFLETETWQDMKISVTANALFLPSECCMHVAFTNPDYYSDAKSVVVSQEQYLELVKYIRSSFRTHADGGYQQISGYAYSTDDAFFEANGRYHFLNTCNSWVGRALRSAGVRAPWLTPLPNSATLYFD